ncbi:MAG: hypothetical protein IJX91_04665 [Clostridia bacterium]|nr:hypothetical protein [Clostridia bacterium]
MRSAAQKAADKKYAAKIQKEKKYERFLVNLNRDEFAYVEEVLKARGMGKAEFLRWAISELEKIGVEKP